MWSKREHHSILQRGGVGGVGGVDQIVRDCKVTCKCETTVLAVPKGSKRRNGRPKWVTNSSAGRSEHAIMIEQM